MPIDLSSNCLRPSMRKPPAFRSSTRDWEQHVQSKQGQHPLKLVRQASVLSLGFCVLLTIPVVLTANGRQGQAEVVVVVHVARGFLWRKFVPSREVSIQTRKLLKFFPSGPITNPITLHDACASIRDLACCTFVIHDWFKSVVLNHKDRSINTIHVFLCSLI